MKKVKSLMLFSLLFSASIGAENAYFGAGYHFGAYDETGVPEANPGAIQLRMGKYVNESVAVEGRVLLGASSDTVEFLGTDIEVDIKNALSVFVKADLPLSESGNFYGLLGFSKGKLEATALGSTLSADDSGLSYGMGIELGLTDNLYFSGEYIMYLSEDDYDYNAFNLGIHKLF